MRSRSLTSSIGFLIVREPEIMTFVALTCHIVPPRTGLQHLWGGIVPTTLAHSRISLMENGGST
jgi:hypothetical protein